ncbi:MAG: hypothetical protein HY053_08890, partial [Proteobacteria bacterium]|nr:hypothetical protein [Pseudomonadota bacterium]
MKFLLPLVFVFAMGVSAPTPALADPPRTAGEGMFDCLGEFDWGCRVMSYLFEDKKNGLPSFRTDVSTTRGVENTDSTSVQTALRKMMGFFSNAMLVIASLILLYHLIVMVAETAHTGTVGGKETNQLWAPIRLVIAIGLLVPIGGTAEEPTGLNSGQYVILQVAKWG